MILRKVQNIGVNLKILNLRIYMKNQTGPRVDSWGTPHPVVGVFDFLNSWRDIQWKHWHALLFFTNSPVSLVIHCDSQYQTLLKTDLQKFVIEIGVILEICLSLKLHGFTNRLNKKKCETVWKRISGYFNHII